MNKIIEHRRTRNGHRVLVVAPGTVSIGEILNSGISLSDEPENEGDQPTHKDGYGRPVYTHRGVDYRITGLGEIFTLPDVYIDEEDARSFGGQGKPLIRKSVQAQYAYFAQ